MLLIQIVFTGLMIASAITDVLWYRIPNWIVLSLLVLFLIGAGLHFGSVNWLSHVSAAALCLVVGFLFYHAGQTGAGDVKLIAVAALWSGLGGVLPLLLFISLAGLLVMGTILVLRRFVAASRRAVSPDAALPRVLTAGQGIPYGVAIAIGAVAAMRFFQAWDWAQI